MKFYPKSCKIKRHHIIISDQSSTILFWPALALDFWNPYTAPTVYVGKGRLLSKECIVKDWDKWSYNFETLYITFIWKWKSIRQTKNYKLHFTILICIPKTKWLYAPYYLFPHFPHFPQQISILRRRRKRRAELPWDLYPISCPQLLGACFPPIYMRRNCRAFPCWLRNLCCGIAGPFCDGCASCVAVLQGLSVLVAQSVMRYCRAFLCWLRKLCCGIAGPFRVGCAIYVAVLQGLSVLVAQSVLRYCRAFPCWLRNLCCGIAGSFHVGSAICAMVL